MHTFRKLLPFMSLSCILVLPALSGCGGGSSPATSAVTGQLTGASTLAAGGAATVYVTEGSGASTILAYGLTSNGMLSPAGTLTLPTGFALTAVAIDPNSGTIYAGGSIAGTGTVLAYAAGSTGAAMSARTITAVNGSFLAPAAMTVDSTGKLYVASSEPAIAVYAATATGSATPTRLITGSATGIVTPLGIAVDSTGLIYVSTVTGAPPASAGQIQVFSASANGNATPSNQFNISSAFYYGVAVDSSNHLFAVVEASAAGAESGQLIEEFSPATETASAGMVRTIQTTSGTYLGGIVVDGVGNLYAVDEASSTSFNILGYAPTSTGKPNLQIASPNLGTSTGLQIAVK
jgi:hypothetical protein